MKIDKTPGADNKVDVKLKLEEQNRNQLTFGAGVSQYEGFFGQLSFQTANFMGRGETLHRVAAGGIARARTTRWRFTEPFLFDRPITGGVDVCTGSRSATRTRSRRTAPAASLTSASRCRSSPGCS